MTAINFFAQISNTDGYSQNYRHFNFSYTTLLSFTIVTVVLQWYTRVTVTNVRWIVIILSDFT